MATRRHEDRGTGQQGAALRPPSAPDAVVARRPLRFEQRRAQTGRGDRVDPVADGVVRLDVRRLAGVVGLDVGDPVEVRPGDRQPVSASGRRGTSAASDARRRRRTGRLVGAPARPRSAAWRCRRRTAAHRRPSTPGRTTASANGRASRGRHAIGTSIEVSLVDPPACCSWRYDRSTPTAVAPCGDEPASALGGAASDLEHASPARRPRAAARLPRRYPPGTR